MDHNSILLTDNAEGNLTDHLTSNQNVAYILMHMRLGMARLEPKCSSQEHTVQ